MATSKYHASVVIPTWNRRDDLEVALASIYAQSVPVEVLVLDDGSTDGTKEMIKKRFPEVIYHAPGARQGPTALRNLGIQLASCKVVFPFDNDIKLVSKHTIEKTLSQFDHPRVAVVAIPYIEVSRGDSTVHHRPPDQQQLYVICPYMGAACAVRRDIFLAFGGYRAELFYHGEESDLAIRLLNAGYIIKAGVADPVHHIRSTTTRSSEHGDAYSRRNHLLFAWHNVPMPYFPAHLGMTMLNGLRHGMRSGRLRPTIRGLALGFVSCVRYWNKRSPVRGTVYRVFRVLKKKGMRPLAEFEDKLPKVPQSA